MAAVKVQATAKEVLDRARSQLGVHEIPYGSNRVPYSVWYGIIGPWCAMFVSWVLYFSGAPLAITTAKGFAYCPYGVAWFKNRGAWAGPSTRPKPGWIVFYNFPGDGVDRVSHTGLVEGVAADGRIIAIEGNTNAAGGRTGGMVMRHYRSLSVGIVGYGMIEYQVPAPPKPDPEPEEDDMPTTKPLLFRLDKKDPAVCYMSADRRCWWVPNAEALQGYKLDMQMNGLSPDVCVLSAIEDDAGKLDELYDFIVTLPWVGKFPTNWAAGLWKGPVLATK